MYVASARVFLSRCERRGVGGGVLGEAERTVAAAEPLPMTRGVRGDETSRRVFHLCVLSVSDSLVFLPSSPHALQSFQALSKEAVGTVLRQAPQEVPKLQAAYDRHFPNEALSATRQRLAGAGTGRNMALEEALVQPRLLRHKDKARRRSRARGQCRARPSLPAAR